MTLVRFILAWLILSGFTMPLEWRMPTDSNHEGFIVEYKPEKSGWREMLKVSREERSAIITEDRPGQYCYRIRAVNNAGRSGPSQNKCGYNQEN